MLYRGLEDRDDVEGLLFWGGVDSDSKKNQLKRICVYVIATIQHLIKIDFGEDSFNVFFERFIRLPLEDLQKLNFCAHMQLGKRDKNVGIAGVCELISVILRDHRNAETDLAEPIDINELLDGDEDCRSAFLQWLQAASSVDVRIVLHVLRDSV